MHRGQMLTLATPQGAEDKRIAAMKMDRYGVFIELTKNGYARIAFFGDSTGLSYLVHPESLKAV